MNTSRKFVAALVSVVSLVGIGSYAVADGKKSNDPLAVTQVPISQDQAVNIALQSVPGTVRATDFDNDNEGMLWDIEIIDSTGQAFDVEINANTGDVVSQKADEDEDDDDDGDHEDDDHDQGSNDEFEGPQIEQNGQNKK